MEKQVRAVTLEVEEAIERKGPKAMPLNPTARGWSAEEIRKAFWAAISDGEASVLGQVKRVITEVNQVMSLMDQEAAQNHNQADERLTAMSQRVQTAETELEEVRRMIDGASLQLDDALSAEGENAVKGKVIYASVLALSAAIGSLNATAFREDVRQAFEEETEAQNALQDAIEAVFAASRFPEDPSDVRRAYEAAKSAYSSKASALMEALGQEPGVVKYSVTVPTVQHARVEVAGAQGGLVQADMPLTIRITPDDGYVIKNLSHMMVGGLLSKQEQGETVVLSTMRVTGDVTVSYSVEEKAMVRFSVQSSGCTVKFVGSLGEVPYGNGSVMSFEPGTMVGIYIYPDEDYSLTAAGVTAPAGMAVYEDTENNRIHVYGQATVSGALSAQAVKSYTKITIRKSGCRITQNTQLGELTLSDGDVVRTAVGAGVTFYAYAEDGQELDASKIILPAGWAAYNDTANGRVQIYGFAGEDFTLTVNAAGQTIIGSEGEWLVLEDIAPADIDADGEWIVIGA